MEDFLKMKWSISGPHELEHEAQFIPEEKIAGSHVFGYLDEAVKIRTREEVAAKCKKPKVTKMTPPGMKYSFVCKKKSRLSVIQQRKCLSALELLQSGKSATTLFNQNDIRVYNDLKQVILDENALFLEHVKQCFSVHQSMKCSGNCKYVKYAEHVWKRDLARAVNYVQFYVDNEMLSFSYSDCDVPIDMLHVANVLELGTVAKFNPPSLIHSYTLNVNSLRCYKDEVFNSKLPVSKDANIDTLLETNNADVVISSSALKLLMDFMNLSGTWCIPVIVKALKKEGSTLTHKVVFLDKPLRRLKPSLGDLHEYCVKKLLKANFCNMKAFSFENEQLPIPTNENTSKMIHDTEREGIENSQSHIDDNHNVSYRIWNLQQQEQQNNWNKSKHKPKEIKVLIRCKLDGCEMTDNGLLQPLTISPKLEYQLEYGGSIPTKTELIKEWTSVYIKPHSQLRRVRTHFENGEVILIERCNIQKINNEAQVHYEYKPRLGLGILYKTFAEMMKHEPGNYLLLHLPKHGPFISLLKEVKESCANAFDLHGEYSEKNFEVVPQLQRSWCPVDVNLILPKHRIKREMPGVFRPLVNNYTAKKLKGNKKKKSKRKKVKKTNVHQ